MAQILVRNLSERAHAQLRKQAAEHHQSLEGEVRAILEDAAGRAEAFVLPALVEPRRRGGKSLAELVSEGRR